MFFFRKRKQDLIDAAVDREVQAIRKEYFKKIDAASKNAVKLNKLLEKDGGVTELIFLASGGDRRHTK